MIEISKRGQPTKTFKDETLPRIDTIMEKLK